MKKITKTFLLSIVLTAISTLLTAQTVSFDYDEAGNRTSREIIYLKSSEADLTDTVNQAIEEEHFIDILQEMRVIISPNPSGGRFTVGVENLPGQSENQQPIELFLHNITGELVYHIDGLQVHNDVDISRKPNGTYILTLISGNEKRTWKVIKQ